MININLLRGAGLHSLSEDLGLLKIIRAHFGFVKNSGLSYYRDSYRRLLASSLYLLSVRRVCPNFLKNRGLVTKGIAVV